MLDLLRLALVVPGAMVAFLSPRVSLADEKLYDLVRQGYSLFHHEGYAEVEECSPDKPAKIGQYIFICDGYNYDYSYGDAMIVGKVFKSKGESLLDVYLCLEDEEDCYDGRAFRP